MTTDVLIALSSDMSGISRLPAALVRHGIRTSVLCAPEFLLSRSRAVHSRFPCRAGARHTAEALRRHLKEPGRSYALVIPGDDQLLQYLARHEAELDVHKILPFCTDIDLHWSKAAFTVLCQREGFPIPQSFIGATQAEAQRASSDVGFPLIFKEPAGSCGETVFRFSSPAELQAYLAVRTGDDPWLIQEYVPGEVLTADVLFDHGNVMAWSTSIVERTCKGPFSSSTARRFIPVPELESTIISLGRVTGMSGLCGVDLIRTADTNKLHLLEMNCRPTIGHVLSTEAGVDFGAALAAMLERRPAPHQPQRSTPLILTFPEDVDRCISERDLAGLIAWLLLPSHWRRLPWNEPRILMRNFSDLVQRMFWGVWKYGVKPVCTSGTDPKSSTQHRIVKR